MTHVVTPECIDTRELIANEVDLLLAQEAARVVGNVVVTPLPKDSDEQIEAAAQQYADKARALQAGRSLGEVMFHLNPDDWADNARRAQRSGGYVVRLVASATESKYPVSLKSFWELLSGLQQVAEAHKNDKTA